jgi:hypothetical protein
MARKLDTEPQHKIFTLRRSIFIWFCGGVIGWAAALLIVYNVFQTTDRQVAQTKSPTDNATTAVANSQSNGNPTGPDPESLAKIAPAAGPASPDKTESAPAQ